MRNLLKKPSFYIIAAIILIVIFFIVRGIWLKNQAVPFDTAVAARGVLKQEVSVTGKVKPAESVDLAFEKSGRVVNVAAKVGDKAKKGQVIISLNSADLGAQLLQANSSLLSAKALLNNYEAALGNQTAKLDEYKKGTRQEEITIAETTVLNAEKALTDSKISLDVAKAKAVIDLNQKLANAASSLGNSINIGLKSIFAITDIQSIYFTDSTTEALMVADAKDAAVEKLLGASGAGNWTNTAINNLNGGAKLLIANLGSTPTEEKVLAASAATKAALQQIRTALISIPLIKLSATSITSINTEKGYVDAELDTVISNEQLIAVQKSTNNSNIATADASVTTATNTLAAAKDQLALKRAGYTHEQITGIEALVRQAHANVDSQKAQIGYAEANIKNIQAQFSKNVLVAPIDGIVTAVDTKVGEIAAPNTIIVKIISAAKFEIEANVAEVDIANIKVGDVARVMLDAYGDDTEFSATVVKIDPAETIIDGVPTYKVTSQFGEENELIKSGMTANLDILTERKEQVVYVPQRAVIAKDSKKIIRIVNADNKTYSEVEVKTGLRGSDGNIEITEGLNEGGVVVTTIKK